MAEMDMMFLVRQMILAGLLLMIVAARADLPTTAEVSSMMKRSDLEAQMHRGHSNITGIVDVTQDDFVDLHNANSRNKVEKVAMVDVGTLIPIIGVCAAMMCTVVAMPVYCGGIGRTSKLCAN